MGKKYFFFDVDGTLVKQDEKAPSKEVIECLEKLRENGHFVAIATGRPYRMALGTATEVGVYDFVCEGGHSICLDSKIVRSKTMDSIACRNVCEEAEVLGMPVLLMRDQSGKGYVKKEEHIDLFNKEIFDIVLEEELDYQEVDSYYRMIIDLGNRDESVLSNLKGLAYLKGPLGNQQIIIEPDCKEDGIFEMVEMMGGSKEDIVVIGDGKNDISMFKAIPFSIAMGNAIDELKELAYFITKDVEEEGVVYACQYFSWI